METKKLMIDDGLIRIDINGNGLLTFNPSDFNVYERFWELSKELPEIEKKYAAEVELESDDVAVLAGRELKRAKEIDAEVKRKLSGVFGSNNDFDTLLGGVNIMAFGSNGERVISNLLYALQPYIEDGVKKHTDAEIFAAKSNREQRRAAQQGAVK